jgi:hypothetical protein
VRGGGLFTNRDSSMGACMCTYPTSFLARARVRGCPNAIIAYGFVKKWKPARVGDDRETRDSRLETGDGDGERSSGRSWTRRARMGSPSS